MGCIELLENLGVRAQDERELVEFLRQVPVGSVFHHTCGYFLRHRIFVGPYANDFATWTAVHLGDRVLGERLAVVDPFDFADLEHLREELISIVSDHLGRLRAPPRVDGGEPFHFIQSHVVEIPTGPDGMQRTGSPTACRVAATWAPNPNAVRDTDRLAAGAAPTMVGGHS